jgi:hypothetical protein
MRYHIRIKNKDVLEKLSSISSYKKGALIERALQVYIDLGYFEKEKDLKFGELRKLSTEPILIVKKQTPQEEAVQEEKSEDKLKEIMGGFLL